MTMEMWEVGSTGDPLRIATLLALTFPLLVGLSYYAGFEHAFGLVDHLLDAFAAIAVAAITGALALALFGVLSPAHPIPELVGKVAVVTFPAALGVLLADKQLGRSAADEDGESRDYWVRLFLMLIGALFVSLNVAPTEEVMLIAHQIGPLQTALLAFVSLALLHCLLFWVDLSRRDRAPHSFWAVLIRFTCAGYAICLAVSIFLLWVFGRTDGAASESVIQYAIVLSFAGVLGAGLAHVVVAERRD